MKSAVQSEEELRQIVQEVHARCNWAYQCWKLHRMLFDDNEDKDNTIGKAKYFFTQLSQITSEYVLLQISKLHDPKETQGDSNISLALIMDRVDFGKEESKAQNLFQDLKEFSKKVKNARNKLISHNDLKAIILGANLGEFDEGEDQVYFSKLQEFLALISEVTQIIPLELDDMIESDLSEFLDVLQFSVSEKTFDILKDT